MRLMAQIIVYYGAILSFTDMFKEISRLAGNEPAQKTVDQLVHFISRGQPVVFKYNIKMK